MKENRDRRHASLVWLPVVAAAALSLGCQPSTRSGLSDETPPNLILISFDTMRADHLGCYGYTRDTSPAIDALARRSTLFRAARAPTPWTLPSHIALLSGRHPFEIGVRDSTASIPPDVALVAELLAEAGYQTAGFVDSRPDGFVGARRGFSRGFDHYKHVRGRRGAQIVFDLERTREEGQSWLGSRDPDRPFFLFLHTKAVHAEPAPPLAPEGSTDTYAPYRKPEPHQTMFVTPGQAELRWEEGGARGVNVVSAVNAQLSAGTLRKEEYPEERVRALEGLYDAGIRWADDQFGELLKFLEKTGLDETTAIVVTADHGEAFLEHRYFLHREPRAQLLHVPMILREPGQEEGRVVEDEVRLEDVAPTLLDLAGLPSPPEMTGRSLLSSGGDRGAHFSYYQLRKDYDYSAHAVRRGDWKLVVERVGGHPLEASLYHVSNDPGEQHPVENGERAEELMALLEDWQARHQDSVAPDIEISQATRDRLRALGYVE